MFVDYFCVGRYHEFYVQTEDGAIKPPSCFVTPSDCWWVIPTWDNFYRMCEE